MALRLWVEARAADDIDLSTAKAELDEATAEAGSGPAAEESPEVKYARARLRAAGEQG